MYLFFILVYCLLEWWFYWINVKQVEAEIRIAAYEACAYALKDLVSVFSPVTLDRMTDSDGSFQSETDDNARLDMFVSTFTHTINQIIDGGKLARTRRAVLMNWKVILPFYLVLIVSWEFYLTHVVLIPDITTQQKKRWGS